MFANISSLDVDTQEAGTTLLSGSLPDQAALHGVLCKSTRLGPVLLSLETSAAPGGEEAREDKEKRTSWQQ